MENYKEYKKDFSKLGIRYAIGAIIIQAAQAVAVLIVKELKPEWLWDINILLILSVVPMYLVGMPILIALVNRLPGKAPEKHKMTPGQFAVAFIMCYAVIYGSNLIGSIVIVIIGLLTGNAVNNSAAVEVASTANMGLTFLYMVLIAPVLEEFVFRKLIVDKTLKYGQGVAIVMSGVMFGLFHGNLSQFVYATTMGMFLAFLYVKTGNLKITIGLHMIVNFIGAVVSVLVLKLIGFEELLESTQGLDLQEQMTVIMNHFMNHLAGWMVYMLYAVVIFGMVIAGVIMLIVFRKRFVLEPGEVALPKGKRFNTMFLNVGMILYCLIWIGIIIAQLLM